jgi:two-component system KDP operon response regulator KdpE
VTDAATAPNVLVVDDEVQIRRFLRSGFELDGYSVNEAENGREAIRAATLRPTDLIILDLGLPDLDGSQVLERVRSWSNVPVIILSVKSSEMEKVRLFELGADDYVTKPFGMAELLARSKVVLRRKARATTGDSVIRIDNLKIDLAARNVFLGDERLTLTPKEYRLLQILAQYPGNVVTHQELLKEIWGLPHINDTHYLRIVVRKLRQKIEADSNRPRILLTELGVGYRLAPPNEPAETTSN